MADYLDANQTKAHNTARAMIAVRAVARLLLVVFLGGSFSLLAGSSVMSSAGSSVDFARVDAFVSSQVSDANLTGVAVGIVHADHVVHLKGFGKAAGTSVPITAQTPFVIGSVSKSFTALAVMQLVEADRVDLDRPVHDYLPNFRLADLADSNQITVRQLLNQTSGIPTEAGIAPLTDPVTNLDAQVGRLAEVRAATVPGASYAYSNANYEVLGRLVEVVSRQDYGSYLGDHVFRPLDMRHSFTSLEPARAAGLSGACELWFGLARCSAPGVGFRPDFVPAGFVTSSAEDMAHYLIAQLNQGRYGSSAVLSPAGIDLLHRPALSAGLSAGGGGYGMGWIRGPRGNLADTIWHNGSAAGFHSMVLMLPASDWAVVVLINSESLLYTMLGRLDVIADGIAAQLVGSQQPGTLAGLYIGFDVAAGLILLLQARTLVRIYRRPPGLPAGKGRVRIATFEFVIPLWRELIAPFALVIGLPAALAAPWVNLGRTDVGIFVLALAALLFLTGVVRAYRLSPVWLGAISRRAHQTPPGWGNSNRQTEVVP